MRDVRRRDRDRIANGDHFGDQEAFFGGLRVDLSMQVDTSSAEPLAIGDCTSSDGETEEFELMLISAAGQS